ncbi:MAG: N-acetylglucosamine-6-phosphate deacetylase [Acidimicrobiia bacterium]
MRADVLVADGVIVAVEPPGSDAAVEAATQIDATGLLVAPGLVDLQINGAYGIDLVEQPERMWELAELLPRHGVTSFLPTIISSPDEVVRAALSALRGRPVGDVAADILGLHLEGPMLNPARRGAHRADHLRAPSSDVIEGWTFDEGVTLVTMAPELEGAEPVITELMRRGVTVAGGHSAANTPEMLRAVTIGVGYVTHLFNAMAPFTHREPGIAGVALADDRIVCAVIADGVHVHPVSVAMAWAAKGPRALLLTSDAVAAAASISIDAMRLGDGTLAGATVLLDQAVRNLVAFTGCSAHDAVRAASSNPAAVISMGHKGRIVPGADADIVVLDEDLDVVMTFVAGRLAHQR